MYDVVETHAMYGCCAAIVSHVRIHNYIHLTTRMMTDKESRPTFLELKEE